MPTESECKEAYCELVQGIMISDVVGNRIVHVRPETANVAIKVLENYISRKENYNE